MSLETRIEELEHRLKAVEEKVADILYAQRIQNGFEASDTEVPEGLQELAEDPESLESALEALDEYVESRRFEPDAPDEVYDDLADAEELVYGEFGE